jgi:hypothetical protein
LGATSTRSRSSCSASHKASLIFLTPICSPSGATTRTSLARMAPFTRSSGILIPPDNCSRFCVSSQHDAPWTRSRSAYGVTAMGCATHQKSSRRKPCCRYLKGHLTQHLRTSTRNSIEPLHGRVGRQHLRSCTLLSQQNIRGFIPNQHPPSRRSELP